MWRVNDKMWQALLSLINRITHSGVNLKLIVTALYDSGEAAV
jgi:hypothetical protein